MLEVYLKNMYGTFCQGNNLHVTLTIWECGFKESFDHKYRAEKSIYETSMQVAGNLGN